MDVMANIMKAIGLIAWLSACPGFSQPALEDNVDRAEEGDSPRVTNESGQDAESFAVTSPIDATLLDLTAATLRTRIDANYASLATYDGPTGQAHGKMAIAEHLGGLLAGLSAFSIEVQEELVSGDETVALWIITYRHPRLGGGELVAFSGSSHFKVQDGKIVAQRDYYDLGAAFYENIPFFGKALLWVKGHL